MYSINGYGHMIADAVRMEAYVGALRAKVKPGAVVLDIGTGTGIFALIACQLGARRVYAIEPSDAIAVGREIARANGYGATIEFIQGLSTAVTLPERADVIVSDLRGVLPFCTRHLPAIADARRRHLAPGGTLIPQRDTLWLACVEAPEAYAHVAGPWFEGAYGLDLRAAFDIVTNTWERAGIRPEQVVSEPRQLGVIEYTTVESADFVATVRSAVTRAATAHGFCAWFDATLAEGIAFSNAPGRPEAIYGKAFFPWSEPVALLPDDQVTVTLKADLIGEDYTWSWNTRVADGADRTKAQFRQSSFYGEPLAPAQLRKQSAAHVATLNDDGIIARETLRMMQEGAALGDIARHLAQRFPGRFASWQDALSHVGELSTRYSR